MRNLLLGAFVFFIQSTQGTLVTIAAEISVSPDRCAIVVNTRAHPWTQSAARELQKHLQLITSREIAIVQPGDATHGRYCFHVGAADPNDKRALGPEEARWVIASDEAHLYGDAYPRHGVEFAVYAFLEEQLGVRWIRPGDAGIGYTRRSPLMLTVGAFSWTPELEMRKIRPYARPGRGYPRIKAYVEEFAEFLPTHEAHDKEAHDVRQWQLRMRMGGHSTVNYGHAFIGWWDKYSKTHPAYFALNRWGKREPELAVNPGARRPQWTTKDRQSVKVCAGNPEVAERLVADWVARGKRGKWINACMNDQVWGFCRCEQCLKLDGRTEGEELGTYLSGLTDRYVHLANAVARLARQHDPEAGAVMYAYETTEQPPRNLRVEPNVVVAIVPTTIDVPKLVKLFTGWKRAGATRMLMRPNYPVYYNTLALPLGAERQMHDAFQAAYEFGVVATDYDSLTGLWPCCGFSDYVLAKTFSDPSKPFADWEEHYCAAFGPAGHDVRAYFRYWREELWEKRLLPDLELLVTKGKYHNFARGLMWSLGDYYRASDFDATDAILAEAAKRDLSESQRQMIDEIALANQNARLILNAATTGGVAKFEHSRSLLEFRKQNRSHRAFANSWLSMFANETRFGDMTGTKTAQRLKDYPLPWIETALAWQFRMDPDNVGLKEKWQSQSWDQVQTWNRLRTDFFWDNPYDSETDPLLAAQLKGYDGIGWYSTRLTIPEEMKQRRTFLYFGAVDESCWIYVNGKLAGTHLFQKSDDWSTPFEIEIGPHIDQDRPFQTVTVRVEDKAGSGGIWKRVWIVSKEK